MCVQIHIFQRVQIANMSKAPIEDMDNDKETVSTQPLPSPMAVDTEKQPEAPPPADFKSAFKALGILDQFLAVWILLAMVIGVLLGNFVPNTGPALQKGKFVGVSVPIGILLIILATGRPC